MTDLTERLLAQARRFQESGATPVTPRPAATVLLLRPAATGFEVYLLRRAASMAFASGVYAFPGGSVDPRDADGDPLPGRWAERLGRSEREAQAVVRAAVRETAEETGVRLDPADLVPWRRWITPEFEPRRYDTYFFVAALPPGQEPADVSGEADRTEWLSPAEALRRFESGRILMLPPTSVTLRELSAYDSVEAVLAAGSTRDAATPVLPRVEQAPDGTARLVY
ncbi:MAG: NUDIX domain-containing protein [Micromonosporaceae bacterium]